MIVVRSVSYEISLRLHIFQGRYLVILGFGDAVDNSECWSPVISYVESQYEAFLDAETRVNRVAKMPDSRVHACLYFIAPSGHGLKVSGHCSMLSLALPIGVLTYFKTSFSTLI